MNSPALQKSIDKLVSLGRELPQVVMPTKSFLLEGMYLRQIAIPQGTCFVGRVHKKPHYFLILKGSCGIADEGGKIRQIEAGMIFMSDPGTQRVGITYEDTIFATIHRADFDNLKDIEEELVEFTELSRYGVGNEILPKRLT